MRHLSRIAKGLAIVVIILGAEYVVSWQRVLIAAMCVVLVALIYGLGALTEL